MADGDAGVDAMVRKPLVLVVIGVGTSQLNVWAVASEDAAAVVSVNVSSRMGVVFYLQLYCALVSSE